MHGVSLEEEDPGLSKERSNEDHYLDMHAKENPTGVATDVGGGTTTDEDVSVRSDSGHEVGVTTSEDNPDTVKSQTTARTIDLALSLSMGWCNEPGNG